MEARHILAPVVAAGLVLAPATADAAGSGGHRAATPRPVAVYVGGQLVASGQSVARAIGLVRRQVPFAIETPRYLPAGYVPVQLAVTPRQRAVSGGFSTLSYVPAAHGRLLLASSSGFQIDQASSPLPVVGGTRAMTVTVGVGTATLHEFKAAGRDILILTGLTAAGGGYEVVTDAATSHLTPATLTRIAASLR